MKASGCDLAEIGARMKAARATLGLSQEGLAKAVGGSKRGIQDNEARSRVPGGEVICGLIDLGINANWLLTGEGPMLLSDLNKEVVREVAPPINAAALGAILAGILQARGSNADPASAAKQAVKFYQEAISEGLITPSGIGEGGAKAA